MDLLIVRTKIVSMIKKLFGIKDFSLYVRKQKQKVQKIFFRKSYTADDIIEVLKKSNIKSGHPIIVHCAMNNFYNYRGTADELIDKLIEFVGPEGTLCMPAFPPDKTNSNTIFDVNESKSAAGYLSEVFRRRQGVKRSLNQLHSVCAYGKDADLIVGSHLNSQICFDEFSPFYIIGQLGGYSISLGLPSYYLGTCGHVCESLLAKEGFPYYSDKFVDKITFTYRDTKGDLLYHTMLTNAKTPYVRKNSTQIIDKNFDPEFYYRERLSNIWINVFDVRYLYQTLYMLAKKGQVIYSHPKFYYK